MKECIMDNANIFSLGMILGGVLVGIAQTVNMILKSWILTGQLKLNAELEKSIVKMKECGEQDE